MIRIFLKEMDGSSVLESVVAAAAASEEAGERPSVREQGAQRGSKFIATSHVFCHVPSDWRGL